ncbi:MAG: M24 family metallopeptidase [Gammaproteobacteria bacterium]|nr:M24 family metallopeptidase [Gammaproteobacteria bacterium]
MTTKTSISERLAAVRALMAKRKLDAYLVLSGDEHLNEYVPETNKRREWISGFSGSAGDFLLTMKTAWLFADSRYHQQADREIDHKHIKISKVGLEKQPSLFKKIRKLARGKQGFRLGYDPFTMPLSQLDALRKELQGLIQAPKNGETGLKMIPLRRNLIDCTWQTGRPAPVNAEVFALSRAAAGQSAAKKLKKVRKALKKKNAAVLPLTNLEQIAWLFNLRGGDISYNPVFIAYAIITDGKAFLFTHADRITKEARTSLRGAVRIMPYKCYKPYLKKLSAGQAVLIAPKDTADGTYQIADKAKGKNGRILFSDNPVQRIKAAKNKGELRGMKQANLLASRAKVRALKCLDEQIDAGETVSEESFRQTLETFYREESAFAGLSFNTIAGTGANSAVVHYSTPDPEAKLEPGDFFLADSGVHYSTKRWCGTTDDTRTVIIGIPTKEQKRLYTLVLKAHVDCARQKFPKGVNGTSLDGITRSALWNETPSTDFGHGCGHGVGCFLNVHEGPHGIHLRADTAFRPGMVTSIEPGYYRSDRGGIRIENLYAVKDLKEISDPDEKPVYGFSPLTYIPFDTRLIDKDMLDEKQLAWVRDYHAKVIEKLTPLLTADEAAWLNGICKL